MIAGAVMQTAAQTGMHVLSKTLTDRYLRAANLRLFKPKGLVVRLCTTAAMQHLVMRTGTGAGPSTLDKIGRGIGTVLVHAPIPFTSRIVRAIADKPPKVHASISAVGDGQKMPLATQRRLASLEGYALPLHLDVPPPAKAQGVMDTMGSWGVAFDEWRTGRKQNKIEQRRRELERVEQQLQRLGINPHGGPPQPGYGGAGPSQGMSYGETYVMGRRERKDLRRAARRARKRERGPGLIGSLIGPKESRLERRVANSDLLEHWASESGLWVVIMNVELGQCILPFPPRLGTFTHRSQIGKSRGSNVLKAWITKNTSTRRRGRRRLSRRGMLWRKKRTVTRMTKGGPAILAVTTSPSELSRKTKQKNGAPVYITTYPYVCFRVATISSRRNPYISVQMLMTRVANLQLPKTGNVIPANAAASFEHL
jgi:hypothetical protein